ncbi:uncharacterized protein LOC127704607 isoform X2 [Mytilus californianus]|uniref:uncharacterized protein LOC127704607 isoform X2 n=1 Tax=Mytilus californianus TaxID=6549 RepID=UPI002246AAEE|nr:uncharacterized protein LOC127704607 isoform X2 [Mytilus californianus]
MEALRSWWEVPSIAHFCSLFRAAFDLPDFDIEDLENCLYAFCEDQESPFIIDLICRLLRGCYSRKDIESYNYEVYLKDIFKYRAATEEKQTNPFVNSDFKSLDLRTKVEVLHQLCDYRLDAVDVMDQLKGLEGDNMRVSPLGSEDSGATYWYFYGNRLYKEDPEPVIEEEKPKKKKKKEKESNKQEKSKGKKGKAQKKKTEETPRSRKGRILSKKRHFESSESEIEEAEESSSEEKYVTPAKQQKSSSKGRQSRSTRKSKTAEKIEEEPKDLGTRRSSRRLSALSTPVREKKTKGGRKNSTVNGNLTDEDSDDDWNTPLSKTMEKTPTSSIGRLRKGRQTSVESSEREAEETETKPKKRGKPRNSVKITPDSSVNGDAEDQNLDDMIDEDIDMRFNKMKGKIRGQGSSRQGSRRNSLENKETLEADNKKDDEKKEATEIKEETNGIEEPMETDDPQGNEVKVEVVDNAADMKDVELINTKAEIKTDANETDSKVDTDNHLSTDKQESREDDTQPDIKSEQEKKDTDISVTNTNNNHDSQSQESGIKEELKNEIKTDSTEVKEENSNMTCDENELNVTDSNAHDSEVKFEDKPPPKPLYHNPRWHLVCCTLEEWTALSESLKDSTTKNGKDLFKCIVNDFLPEMPAILEARERDKRKRQAEMAPRRVSARITMKMREFLEQERILEEAHQLEEQTRKEEEEEREKLKEIERQEEERRLREERQKAREERQNRLLQREQRAALLAMGKEIPPELMYTGNSSNSKYIDDDRVELDRETLDDMEKMMEEIKSHKDSWPFLDPVEEEIAPGYHEIIKKPMDLSTIEKKLTSGGYRTTKKFVADFNLMINNCFQFSGADSELGRMATRLRKYINKCIKIYIDKTDEDQDDEDFHGSIAVQTERKWRPRRAATSRALDTIKGAFDDDKFEELTSTPGHEYASSSRKKRLIPELSADSPSKQVINGERIIKNPDTKTNSASRVWSESTETTKETKILTVNGKTFVYKFNTSPMNTKKKIIEKPAYSISESPEKTTTIELPTVTYSGMNTLNTAPKLLVRPPSVGGAILPVSSMPVSSPSSIATVNTPTGPKIIRIMSPNMGQGKSTVQPTVPTSTPLKAIRISDGMLLLDGKPTGIHISGKTKIIYRGAVSSSQTSTTEQNAIMVTSGQVNPTGTTNPAVRSNSHVVGQVITPALTGQNNSLLSTGQVSGLSTMQASAQPITLAKASPVMINQPLVQSTVQSTGQQISLITQPVIAASSVTPAIKTVQPSSLLKSVHGQISSVCDGSLITKSIGPKATTSVTSLCQTFSLSSPVLSNQNSPFPPHTNTVVKSSPVHVSTNQDIVTGKIPNISVLEHKTNQSQVSVLQTEVIKKCEESLMGPPLLVPPKRKLSGSPENKSILPPKLLHVIGHSPSNNVIENCDKSESCVSPPNITFMGSSDSTDKADNLCCDNDNSVGASEDNKSQNMVNSASASDIFPPYKIAHSNSPDKGNLFEILKTNLTESSKPVESSNSQDSCDSGLSKGMMDKVSTFAASLQSKTLSGQLNIPSHLLQKSPTKDDQKVQNLSLNKKGNLS